jgi:UDP-N-acetylglucosamine acyltransferase
MDKTNFHPTAIVSEKAEIGENVKIGAFSIIEDDVVIGDNTEIRNGVVLANGSRIGKDCTLYAYVVVGTEPQDLKYEGEKTLAIVGDRTVLREYVTVNRGTKAHGETLVGSDCYILGYSHIAHDCIVGDNCILSNLTHLGGHTELGDWVITGGYAKFHQFTKVGDHVMVGADVKVVKDIPPYTLCGSIPPKIDGLNKIGLRRRGFSREQIDKLEEFYKIILHSGMNNTEGLAKYIADHSEIIPEVQRCIDFINSSERGIYR